MSEASKIAAYKVSRAPDGPEVAFEDLWKDSRCVIVFLRRFGWRYCRLVAKELSCLKPILDQNGVRFVAVAPGSAGVEAFLKRNFFSGEVFIDDGRKAYKALQYNEMSFSEIFCQWWNKSKWSATIEKAHKMGLKQERTGNPYQNGGLVIVDRGGETMLNYKQKYIAEFIDNEDILKALGIEVDEVPHVLVPARELQALESLKMKVANL